MNMHRELAKAKQQLREQVELYLSDPLPQQETVIIALLAKINVLRGKVAGGTTHEARSD